MKKYLKSLFLALFTVAVIFGAASVQAHAEDNLYPSSKIGVVTVKDQLGNPSTLAIYQDPANPASAYTFAQAQYGWVVDVLGTNGSYYKIRFYSGNASNVYEGYVAASGIEFTTLPNSEKFENLYGYVGVSKFNAIDIRSTSNPRSVINIINKGAKVTVIGRSAHWYKVQTKVNGVTKVGYVYNGLITVQNALNSTYITLSYNKAPVKNKNYTIKVVDKCPVALKKTITWSSSNKKVVTVSSKGVFKIKKAGSATITCTIKCGNRKAYKRTLKLKVSKKYKFSK